MDTVSELFEPGFGFLRCVIDGIAKWVECFNIDVPYNPAFKFSVIDGHFRCTAFGLFASLGEFLLFDGLKNELVYKFGEFFPLGKVFNVFIHFVLLLLYGVFLYRNLRRHRGNGNECQ